MSATGRKRVRDAIAEIGKAGAYEIHQGKVLSVDTQALTMNVEVLELTFYDVRLRAVVTDDTGVWILPKVGSYVSIAQIEGGVDMVLVRASEIDKLVVKIGGKTLDITASRMLATYGDSSVELRNEYVQLNSGSKQINVSDTAVVINNGANGGLVKSLSVAGKLNVLEVDDNAIKSAVTAINAANVSNPATPVTTGMLAGFFAAFINLVPIVPTVPVQLENPNATH